MQQIQKQRNTQNAVPLPRSLAFATKLLLRAVLPLAVLISTADVVSAQTDSVRPCNLYEAATPCVAAFSTTRALYREYRGPLYQVKRHSDKAVVDIGLDRDGYADIAKHDKFCDRTTCLITKIYDQSANHNDLTPAPPGGAGSGPEPDGYDRPARAEVLPISIAHRKAYGIAISPGMGYRNDNAIGTAVNGEPEGVYMVTSALDLNEKCCFDFGNAETNNLDDKAGAMDAINIRCTQASPCTPKAGLDMENGIYGGLTVRPGARFVTDMGANDGQHNYAIYQGDERSDELTTTGVIPLPEGYQPMRQQGAIILGIGGDNSHWASGYFFEGVMTKGMPDKKAMEEVHRNVVAAEYADLNRR